MELADMQDLGSCAAGRVGSSPTFRIIALYRKKKSGGVGRYRRFLCVNNANDETEGKEEIQCRTKKRKWQRRRSGS